MKSTRLWNRIELVDTWSLQSCVKHELYNIAHPSFWPGKYSRQSGADWRASHVLGWGDPKRPMGESLDDCQLGPAPPPQGRNGAEKENGQGVRIGGDTVVPQQDEWSGVTIGQLTLVYCLWGRNHGKDSFCSTVLHSNVLWFKIMHRQNCTQMYQTRGDRLEST